MTLPLPSPETSRRDLLTGSVTTGSPRMRDSRKKRLPTKGATPPPSLAIIALNRMGYGPRPGDIDAFQALGPNDDARLTAYVDQQLDPDAIVDTEADNRIADAGFETLNKSREQLWADHHVNNTQGSSYHNLPRDETERATYIKAVYSKRQLFEVLADFWHNHFNVYGGDYWVAGQFVHYDRDVIRGNMLGNFRQMLNDVAMSTAMLYYLDNYTSTNAGPNENFCRELFELMTLGAENYLGVLQQNQVPLDGNGKPIGYVDPDVFEATRAFTGWTVNNSTSTGNTGAFLYRDDWHDRFQKTVLGTFLPQDQEPLRDGNDVLDVLAEHPGTARFIARKLCRRLIADNPPQSVIDAAAAVFAANTTAPDQLAQVVRTILLSNEFKTTWGEKSKRPFDIAISALRAADADFTFMIDHSDTNNMLNRVRDAGHRLYYWPAPNGYPDTREAWQSSTPRALSWRMVNWMIDLEIDGVDETWRLDVIGQTPPDVRSANELADYWIDRVLGRPMAPSDRQEIVEFMAHGFNADLDLPLDASDSTRDRLRMMVGLLFMTPDFLYR